MAIDAYTIELQRHGGTDIQLESKHSLSIRPAMIPTLFANADASSMESNNAQFMELVNND